MRVSLGPLTWACARAVPSRPKPPERPGPRGRSAADLAHAPFGADEGHLPDGMAGPLAADLGLDGSGQVVVGPAVPQDRPQICLADGEQAVAELALGREADPVAVAAERLGDAGDDADVAGSVPIAPCRGRCRTPAWRRQRL